MRVATAVYTLASVAVLVLMIMRPPIEVSSSPSAAASAPAPEASAPAATSAPAPETSAPAAASAPAPEATAPAAATLPEQTMPAVTAPVAVDVAAPVAPTTAVAPTAIAPVPAVAPVAPVAPPPPPAAPDQAVMMPPPSPTAIAPPSPSGLAAPEEKKNDAVAPAAAKLAPVAATTIPDYAQEQRLVSELSGAIREGEIVSLNDGAQPFMGILTAAEQPRGGVILLHGCGKHPDWADVVHPLRVGLVSKGWTTLSLQMPLLAQTAQSTDYAPLFSNANQRIDAGIALLKQKGINNVVLAAHNCGAHMAMHWLGTKGDSTIRAYVGMGMGEVLPLDTVKVPVLDVYGEKDLPAALNNAPERQRLMQKAGNTHSKQMVLPEADHSFKDKGDALNAVVTTWLNSLPL